jgi:hypothetical protein
MHTPKPSTVTASAAGTEGTRKERSDAHTPWPWQETQYAMNDYATVIYSAGGTRICELEHWKGTAVPEMAANAALIAAAPELLEALEMCKAHITEPLKGAAEKALWWRVSEVLNQAKGA